MKAVVLEQIGGSDKLTYKDIETQQPGIAGST